MKVELGDCDISGRGWGGGGGRGMGWISKRDASFIAGPLFRSQLVLRSPLSFSHAPEPAASSCEFASPFPL